MKQTNSKSFFWNPKIQEIDCELLQLKDSLMKYQQHYQDNLFLSRKMEKNDILNNFIKSTRNSFYNNSIKNQDLLRARFVSELANNINYAKYSRNFYEFLNQQFEKNAFSCQNIPEFKFFFQENILKISNFFGNIAKSYERSFKILSFKKEFRLTDNISEDLDKINQIIEKSNSLKKKYENLNISIDFVEEKKNVGDSKKNNTIELGNDFNQKKYKIHQFFSCITENEQKFIINWNSFKILQCKELKFLTKIVEFLPQKMHFDNLTTSQEEMLEMKKDIIKISEGYLLKLSLKLSFNKLLLKFLNN